MTNILLMNIPSGPYPTDYPPIGISRVIEGIDPLLNCYPVFLDLDYCRPEPLHAKYKCRLMWKRKILTGMCIIDENNFNISVF